tara:strand:- start:1882 stop:2331 length:450 start_codon:yes stop_codon:yes gene_type:complete
MECLICFCDVSNNDYLLMDCCNKIIHIECIKTWINTNKNTNKEIDKCIFCKQQNDIINNLLHQENNNSIVNNNHELLITITTPSQRSRIYHFKIFIINSMIICIFIFIATLFVALSSQTTHHRHNYTRGLLEQNLQLTFFNEIYYMIFF